MKPRPQSSFNLPSRDLPKGLWPSAGTLSKVHVIDSHTGGEPTRVVIAGGPNLGPGTLAECQNVFQTEFNHFRSAIVNEPRGSDVLVGALLLEPRLPDCDVGAIFFNNVSVLGMCGHATIGLAVSLAHLGWIEPGEFRLDTPVGPVGVEYHGGATATVANVLSYRYRAKVPVDVEGVGRIHGDVAWGGNWFFLTDAPAGLPLHFAEAHRLNEYAKCVRRALEEQGITGANGEEIDHIELMGPPHDARNQARNFVLCPGGAYDRSPCGTGTSAKLSCLAAEDKLKPGEAWRQEGILGSVFEGRYELAEEGVLPRITGQAYVTAEATLLIDRADPYWAGVRE